MSDRLSAGFEVLGLGTAVPEHCVNQEQAAEWTSTTSPGRTRATLARP